MRKKTIIGSICSSLTIALSMGLAVGLSNQKKVEPVEAASTLNNGGYDEGEYHYYDGTYYDSIGDSSHNVPTGTNLLSALCTLVKPSSSFGYDSLLSLYYTSDIYPNDYDGTDPLTGNPYPTQRAASNYRGKIWDMYADSLYTPGPQPDNYSLIGDMYNREHTVPQSWFNKNATPKSDPHHIFPTDGKVNGQRSNYPYGEATGSLTKVASNGSVIAFGGLSSSPVTTYGSCGSDKIFEPEDAYKGDIARGILYMAAAYYNYSQTFALSNTCFERSGNYNLLSSYYINLLTKWSEDDPVSQKEIDRNNVIYASKQGNRNPFIDHPNWAYKIWGGTEYTWGNSSSGTDPKVKSVSVSPSTLTLDLNGTKTGSLTANVNAVNGAPTTVTWSISPSNKGISVSNGTVTAGNDAEVGTYTVTATSTYDLTKHGTCTVTVKDSSQGGGGGAGGEYIITPENCGWSTTAGAQSGTPFDGITVSCTNGILVSGTRFTTYKNATFTIASTIGNITQLDFTFVGSNNGGFNSTVTPNASSWSKLTTSGSSGTQAQMTQLVVTLEGGSSEPTLSSISVSTAPDKTTYVVGECFDPTGLVINRTFSDDSLNDTFEYEEHEGEFSFTPNTTTALTASNTSVTIGYGGKTTTQSITVNAAPATSITASVSKTYYVGETISSSDITVKDNNNNTVSGFTFADDGYQFKFADASSGGALTNKVFTNKISYNTLVCSLTVQVQRKARITPSSSTKSISYSDLPTGYDTSSDERTASSGIAFVAYNLAHYSNNKKMQFKASGGYLQTTQELNLQTLTINNRETRVLTVLAGNSQNSISTEISGTNDVYNLSGYSYLKIINNNGNAAYCTDVVITYGSADSAVNLANYIMYEDTPNQCTSKFITAKGYFEGLTSTERSTFMNSNDYVIKEARDRLNAWAAHEGKSIIQSNGDYVIASARVTVFDNSNRNTAIICVIAVFATGVTILGSYFLIKRKREN
ncbi:MAG: endonuclease [Bacilli bacterium]|nr:endonuclease [Bacilli bacterium]